MDEPRQDDQTPATETGAVEATPGAEATPGRQPLAASRRATPGGGQPENPTALGERAADQMQQAAEGAAQERLAEQGDRMDAIHETGAPYLGPPPEGTARRLPPESLGGPGGSAGDQTPPYEVSGQIPGGSGKAPTTEHIPIPPEGQPDETGTTLTPEGLEADTKKSPGEAIRRRGTQ